MQTCDVLIVGGGPAGSSLAWGLRNSDLDIIVMDKQNFPRNKTCAGWITPAVIKSLQLDSDVYAHDHTFQPVRGFRIGRMDNNVITITYAENPVSYGIRRCEFDHYLLQRCGAKLYTGQPVRKIQRKNSTWIINESIQARLLVGAGGHFCPVARFLGARVGRTETAVSAQEIEFRLDENQKANCNVDPEIPELYFCRDLKGYGWILRKGEYLNIGLGREDQHHLSEQVFQFCDFLRQMRKINFDVSEKFNGHAYLLYRHSSRPEYADGILLIGDATGLAYTQSGEGIRPAIESGLMAADIIRNAHGNYSVDNLAPYSDVVSRRFGNRKTGSSLLPGLPEGIRNYLGQNLLASEWFARNIVINRWFLHSHQPSLPELQHTC